jgi:hypothetical protein
VSDRSRSGDRPRGDAMTEASVGSVLGVVISLLIGGLLAFAAAFGLVTATQPDEPEPLTYDFSTDYGTR